MHLIALESVFNPDDQAREKSMKLATDKDDYTPVVVTDGKTLNMGKVCFENEKKSCIHLCQEFNDVFA